MVVILIVADEAMVKVGLCSSVAHFNFSWLLPRTRKENVAVCCVVHPLVLDGTLHFTCC